MNEFSLIHRYFAPLAGENGLGLRDDAALLTPPHGKQLVITQDAMTAGVHFFNEDPADLIARKLLRVNLSDLAAKGAEPLGYLLSLLMPADTSEEWVELFAQGLEQDQKEFGMLLMGGDTSSILGPMTLSLTAIGTVDAGQMLPRSDARVGDHLYVSGTIGDAALGLKVRCDELPYDEFLLGRYLLPQPRFHVLPVTATACMDISDGLVQDAEHLAQASGVHLVIEAEKVPLSNAARHHPGLLNPQLLFTGGDDYELLFTAPPHLPGGDYTQIGYVTSGSGVTVQDAAENEIPFDRKGWQHF